MISWWWALTKYYNSHEISSWRWPLTKYHNSHEIISRRWPLTKYHNSHEISSRRWPLTKYHNSHKISSWRWPLTKYHKKKRHEKIDANLASMLFSWEWPSRRTLMEINRGGDLSRKCVFHESNTMRGDAWRCTLTHYFCESKTIFRD